jgi:hydroxymethylpyrimidine/phosphomethylpyrimidine kinase
LEAETLTATKISSEADMRRAAIAIRKMGASAVLIKGGHLVSEAAIDVLDNEGQVTVFRQQRITGAELHGSGCILSAAIAAGLGKEMTLEDSVGAAKQFVLQAIRKVVSAG